MLQQIRDRAQGIIVWTIVGLIVIAFATFGLNSYLGGSGGGTVAVVDGTEISEAEYLRALRNYQDQLQRLLGKQLDPAMLDPARLRPAVIEGLVERVLLEQFLDDAGFAASPRLVFETLAANPAFQENGKFSRERYRRLLRAQRIDERAYEASVAQDLLRDHLRRGVAGSGIATRAEAWALLRAKREVRDVGVLEFALKPYLVAASVSDEAVREYYEANKESFREPEQVRVQYVELNLETLARSIAIDEQSLRDYYEQNRRAFATGKAERRARHILIKVDADTPDAEARKKAEEALARIRSGEPFEKVAREMSEDKASAEQGGDLGFFTRDAMVKPFADLVFSLKAGEVGGPVRTRFGYHVVKVEAVREPEIPPFEKVKDKILRELQLEQAEERFYELSEKLYNLSEESPDSLEPVAQELGLEIKTSDWFSRAGGPGVLAHRDVVEAAFSPEVMEEGRNSPLIDVDDTRRLVLRVIGHREARVKPLEAVKDLITARLKREQAAEAARQAAEAAAARLAAGEAPEKVAAAVEGAAWKRIGWVEREGPRAGARLARDLRRAAFALPLPQDGKAGVKVQTVSRAGGEVAVVAVFGRRLPEKLDDKDVVAEQRRLAAARGQDDFEHLMRFLRQTADVSITPAGDEGA